MAVVGLINTQLDAETMWNLIPDFVENQGDPLFFEADELLELSRLNAPLLLPLVDTRHLWGDVATELQGYVERGFRGIKGIYLADNENDLGVGNVPDTFGISLDQYRRREWEIFAFAEAHDLPLLYHMDARRYGDLMEALLQDFPRLRVDFAHFGIGRNAFRKLLDRYPNVYTDLASMLPYIKRDPTSYRDFVLHYPDRVCFGSDACLYAPEIVLDYIRAVRELKLPEEIESQLFSENPRRFLGRALEPAVGGKKTSRCLLPAGN
jgi:Amidohydrolase